MITTKQLTTWQASANRSGIDQEYNELDDLIRNTQKNIFTNIYLILKDRPVANISKIWANECTKQNDILKSALNKRYPNASLKDIQKVINKVRGNSGEIFTEKLIIEGYLNTLDVNKDTYQCENGFNEDKEDASAQSKLNPNVHIGIQVKNNSYEPISINTLNNSGYMCGYWERQTNVEDIEDYRKFPRQIIVSFTEPENDKFFKDHINKSMIHFVGPRDINKLLGNQPIAFFKEIAEEI